jgi:hypothetical protein
VPRTLSLLHECHGFVNVASLSLFLRSADLLINLSSECQHLWVGFYINCVAMVFTSLAELHFGNLQRTIYWPNSQ